MPATTFDCPRCGAPLDPPVPTGATLECPYCQNTVVIPESLRSPAAAQSVSAGGPQPAPVPVNLDEVRNLLQAGKKLDAIRLLRESTSLSLKEAVNAVEALGRGEPVRIYSYRDRPPSFISIDPRMDEAAFASLPGLEAELRLLLQRRQRVDAIRLLRERLDLSLKVADTTLALLASGLPLSEALEKAGASAAAARATSEVSIIKPAASQRAAGAFTATTVGGCSLFAIFITFFAVIVPLVAVGAALLAPDGPLGELGARLNPLAFARLELSFGEEGEGQGYFQDLRLLALAPDGTVYTSEFETGRVQHFDASGKFLNLWFVPASIWNDEVYLDDLTVGPDGRVYAVTRGEILVFDGVSGAHLSTVQPVVDEKQLRVYALAFGPDGTPYALANDETLLHFDLAWQPTVLASKIIDTITKDSESDGHLSLDGSGWVYVLGSSNQSIFKYDREGAYLNHFGSQGDQKGQFNYAHNLVIDNHGRVIVSDSAGILIFTGDGLFLRQFRIPGVAFDLAVDAQNRLWLATNHQRVLVYQLTSP